MTARANSPTRKSTRSSPQRSKGGVPYQAGRANERCRTDFQSVLFFSPEGAAVNSPGRQPREQTGSQEDSPEGAAVSDGVWVSAALSGLGCCVHVRWFPGLAPRAIDDRPFGA